MQKNQELFLFFLVSSENQGEAVLGLSLCFPLANICGDQKAAVVEGLKEW